MPASGDCVLLVSSAQGWLRHARLALGPAMVTQTSAGPLPRGETAAGVAIVHVSSLAPSARDEVLSSLARGKQPIAVAADVPDLNEMLDLSRFGVRAYFNSYMADVHYRQMVTMLRDGLTWFSPPLMVGAMELARRTLSGQRERRESTLAPLTRREREIAADVAAGMSNLEIAAEREITERTVKAHLTRIFKKLGTRNRHALAVKLRES